MKKFLSSKLFRLIWTVALAFLLYYICPPCFSKSTLLKILALLVVILNVFPFLNNSKGMTHTIFFWFIQIVRIGVGSLFIFSGFIKANDPLGFSYKLAEYFEVFKADTGLGLFDWFHGIALPLAIIITVSEMILGFMLLLGFKRNLTLWLLFAQIAFFTFLTFYSACYNKVTHCGCFGDFLPLKPWESFWKDVVLMIAIAVLFTGKENINEVFRPYVVSILFALTAIASIAFPVYAYRNLPPLDFRAYAPGLSIKEGMKKGEGYKDPVYETMLVYENIKTGMKKEFNNADYMKSKVWEDTLNWRWDTTVNKLISEAVNPPKITDFSVSTPDGDNITDSLLNIKGYYFFLVCYDINKTEDDKSLHARINDFYTLVTGEGKKFIALTSSGAKEINDYKHAHQALYDFAIVDQIVLKTMVRSNPGLMLMNDGKVIANWHHNNFPSYSEVKDTHMKK